MKDNNPEVYEIFSEGNMYSMHDERKWTGLTPNLFSNKTGYNEGPYK